MNKFIEQNGIIKPLPTSMAGQAWTIFDQLGRSFTVRAALIIAKGRGLNESNVRTELCRWRRFHNIRMR